jgi:hypothetical protein
VIESNIIVLPFTVTYIIFPLPMPLNTFCILFSNTLDNNQLTGTIPSEIGLLTSLENLILGK